MRRLIVLAARGLVVTPRTNRPMPAGLKLAPKRGARVLFPLFDPPRYFSFQPRRRKGPGLEPRIYTFTTAPLSPLYRRPAVMAPVPTPQNDDGLVSAKRLGRRLDAIKGALDNLAREARRLVRLRARRARIAKYKLRTPLRLGPPPGHRRVPQAEIDHILERCHALAHETLTYNTS